MATSASSAVEVAPELAVGVQDRGGHLVGNSPCRKSRRIALPTHGSGDCRPRAPPAAPPSPHGYRWPPRTARRPRPWWRSPPGRAPPAHRAPPPSRPRRRACRPPGGHRSDRVRQANERASGLTSSGTSCRRDRPLRGVAVGTRSTRAPIPSRRGAAVRRMGEDRLARSCTRSQGSNVLVWHERGRRAQGLRTLKRRRPRAYDGLVGTDAPIRRRRWRPSAPPLLVAVGGVVRMGGPTHALRRRDRRRRRDRLRHRARALEVPAAASALVERDVEVGLGTSKANSGIIHGGHRGARRHPQGGDGVARQPALGRAGRRSCRSASSASAT